VASGVSEVSTFSLWLADQGSFETTTPERTYDVNLYFVEPEDLEPGDRRFEVRMQGEVVLSDFDVAEEAGGPRRAVVKTVEGIMVADELRVELSPIPDSRIAEPVISGIEVIERE
jgi:hypothetical protein